MIETLAALLLAHALADFVFQTGWMVANKSRLPVLALHAGIAWAASLLVAGHLWSWPVLVLGIVHLAIDRIKLWLGQDLRYYLLDQAAHLLSIALVAAWVPGLWASGWWAALAADQGATWLPAAMAVTAGMIFAVRAGGFAVAALLAPYARYWNRYRVLSGGLRDAGRRIGELERGLTFILVIAGYPTGVAILIAAKSVLRFNATREDRRIAEYVIIGTLASVGWALLVAFSTEALLLGLGHPTTSP
ncbi:DUF3307 domain-containing protein [Tropicimonas sp. IMCC34043]|uniref:DUF3307 domain-containing protein n=1 Tax=Tropicimonas sp. IMCC34043 TaxID=2248760 RepID=UPI000E24A06E|nr:DUF3307 domain-containing protein [Tropicimonas sp. IMCC34043]